MKIIPDDTMIFPAIPMPLSEYDDDDIPQVDLPQDVSPDDVPRKDGPGGEGGE